METTLRVLEFAQHCYDFSGQAGCTEADANAAVQAYYDAPPPEWMRGDVADYQRRKQYDVCWRDVRATDAPAWGRGWLRVEGGRMVPYLTHWDST